MRAFGGNKLLGLAVGENSILAAEVALSGGSMQARRLAEFTFPAGISLTDPHPLGKALGAFLRENRFTARQAVIGLPLKWAMVRPKEVPPADPALLADLLRLHAERDFAVDPQDLVFEYTGAGPAGTDRPTTVLLVAAPRRRVEAVTEAAGAAGLSVRAVTLSAVALGAAAAAGRRGGGDGGDGLILHVAPGSAELTAHHEGRPHLLRHLRVPAAAAAAATPAVPVAAPSNGSNGANGSGVYRAPEGVGGRMGAASAPAVPPAMVGELRQVLALMPHNGTMVGGNELVVWDGIGLGGAPRAWGEALGVEVREESLAALGVSGVSTETVEGVPAARFAPAVALALSELIGRQASSPPDFLHPRLVPPRQPRVQRRAMWAAIAAVAVAVLVAVAWWDLRTQNQDIAGMKQYLKDNAERIKEAESTIARVTFAEGWDLREPRYLSILRELTLVFPDDGQAWASSVVLREETPAAAAQGAKRPGTAAAPVTESRGSLVGRAMNREAALTILERLRASGQFTDIKMLEIREVGRGSREVIFSLSFTFKGGEAAATAPAGGEQVAGGRSP